MAVLIAGTGAGDGLRGLAPEAKILPVRMQQETGSDPGHIADAVKFAIAQHVKVINMSLGTADTAGMAAAVKQAEAADIVVVAAAGNARDRARHHPGGLSRRGGGRRDRRHRYPVVGLELRTAGRSHGSRSGDPCRGRRRRAEDGEGHQRVLRLCDRFRCVGPCDASGLDCGADHPRSSGDGY